MNPTNRAPEVTHVTLTCAGTFGPTSEVLNHLFKGHYIASKPYRVLFDADTRFLRVECEAGTVHLVPLTNVASITLVSAK